MSEDVNIISIKKDNEQYIFLYNDDNRTEMLRILGRYASDVELSFSWYDAALIGQKIRELTHQTTNRLA